MQAPAYWPRPVARAACCAAAALVCLGSATPVLAKPRTHQVVIEAMRFSPQQVEVARGDKIVWINKDPYPHTVTAQDRRFDSGQIAPMKSWTLTARRNGTFSYACTLHPTMQGSLLVR